MASRGLKILENSRSTGKPKIEMEVFENENSKSKGQRASESIGSGVHIESVRLSIALVEKLLLRYWKQL